MQRDGLMRAKHEKEDVSYSATGLDFPKKREKCQYGALELRQ